MSSLPSALSRAAGPAHNTALPEPRKPSAQRQLQEVFCIARAFSKDSIILWLFKTYYKKKREFGTVFHDKNQPGIGNYVRPASRRCGSEARIVSRPSSPGS